MSRRPHYRRTLAAARRLDEPHAAAGVAEPRVLASRETITRACAAAAEALEPRRLLAVTPVDAVGTEFLVNTTVAGTQTTGAFESFRSPRAVASDADGDFVAVWSDDAQDGSNFGVYARRFDALGSPRGSEFRVNVFTAGRQDFPAVAMDADGDFVVAWQSNGQDGNDFGVFARRYSAAGVAQGGDFPVNTTTAGRQSAPSVAMDADGDFAVAWENYDGYSVSVYARRFSAAGVPQGGEVAVASTANNPTRPSVAMDADGDFAVAWNSYNQDAAVSSGVYVRRFSAAGVPQGAEVPVNTTTAGEQVRPSVAMDGAGDFVVAWQSFGQDEPGGYGIYARRFNAAGVPQGGEIAVNNTITEGNQTFPSVAMDGDGNFSVAFQTKSFGGSQSAGISLRQFTRGGAALGDQTGVTTVIAGDQVFPSVASDTRGNLVVLYSGNGPGDSAGVFARQFRLPGALPRGGEIPVNTTTASVQAEPSTAMDADGDFVVAWQGSDGSNYGVYARRFNAAGVPLGNEFLVNTTTDERQRDPSVAMDADGDFVIAWQSFGQDGDGFGIYARRFNAAGVPQGAEISVNTIKGSNQTAPSVAMDAAGDFAVAWQSFGQDASGTTGIYAQRFNAAGVPQGGEVPVNTTTADDQANPSVAMDGDGDFVVAWDSYQFQDSSRTGVYARRFNAAGVAQGGEVAVNTTTTSFQSAPSVAMDGDGDFAVAWMSLYQDGDFWGIYARRFSAAGVPQGGEVAVNTTTANNQLYPSLAMDADGDFAVAWHSFGQHGGPTPGYDVYARRFNAAGVPQSGEIALNTTDANPTNASIAMDGDGDFAVAWQSFGQDGDNFGIFARTFAGGPPVVAAATFSLGPQRIVYRFTRDVGGSLSATDLVLHNDTTAQTLPTSAVLFAYDPATRTATFTAAAPGGFPAGSYTATLLADGVTDVAGQSLDGNANGRGGDDHLFHFATNATAPSVTSTAVNDGAAQRSQVKSIKLTFDRAVTLAAGALKLELLNTGGSGTNNGAAPTNASAVLAAPTTGDGGVSWTWTFVGGNAFMQLTGAGTPTGSLVDGIYKLTVDPTKVTANGVAMSAAPAPLTFHRLFGDVNGSKNVNASDYNAFRGAFGKTSGQAGYDTAFDFDNNSSINATDYNQFRGRFGKAFIY